MLELDTQGPHFWGAVETQQFAPLPRCVVAQRLDRLEPTQCHEGQKQKDGFETVKTGRQPKVLAAVTQEPAEQQRRQSQQYAALGNIKRGGKTRGSLVKLPKACRQPLHRRGRAATHRGDTISFRALALG